MDQEAAVAGALLFLKPEGHMDRARRQFLRLAAGGAALPLLSPMAAAQDYPSRPARLLLGYTTGRTTDIISRLVTQPLTEPLPPPFALETRPSAGPDPATATDRTGAPYRYTLTIHGE